MTGRARGWRYPEAHDLYKVTYIRHIKSRGLSVTKTTKKRNGRLFVTKMREFSVESFGDMGRFNTEEGGLLRDR